MANFFISAMLFAILTFLKNVRLEYWNQSTYLHTLLVFQERKYLWKQLLAYKCEGRKHCLVSILTVSVGFQFFFTINRTKPPMRNVIVCLNVVSNCYETKSINNIRNVNKNKMQVFCRVSCVYLFYFILQKASMFIKK